jgi:cell division protein FtsB
MSEFNKKNEKYSFWHSPLMLFVLFLILIIFSYNLIGLFIKERETARNRVSELNKINDLKQRKDALSSDINNLKTDKGIEEIVRDKFQVVKPGEQMVVIVDGESADSVNSTSEKSTGFWSYIKGIFVKK